MLSLPLPRPFRSKKRPKADPQQFMAQAHAALYVTARIIAFSRRFNGASIPTDYPIRSKDSQKIDA
jgi:hypothetical protein